MTNEFDVIARALDSASSWGVSSRVDVEIGEAIAALATLRAKSAEQEAEVQRLRGLIGESLPFVQMIADMDELAPSRSAKANTLYARITAMEAK